MTHQALAASVLGALLLAQAGATPRTGGRTPSGSALDQLTNSVTRPLPAVPPPAGQHPADVWVPDRFVPVPGQPGSAYVPGHWERRISGRENYVPPLVVTMPDGRTVTLPAGVIPPPEQRQTP